MKRLMYSENIFYSMRHLSDYEFDWNEDKGQLIFKETDKFTDEEEEKIKYENCEIEVKNHKEYLEYIFQTDDVEMNKVGENENCKFQFTVKAEKDKMIGMIQIISYLSQLLSFGDKEIAEDVLRKNLDFIENEDKDIGGETGIRYIQ